VVQQESLSGWVSLSQFLAQTIGQDYWRNLVTQAAAGAEGIRLTRAEMRREQVNCFREKELDREVLLYEESFRPVQ
jgi:hypothetical protein